MKDNMSEDRTAATERWASTLDPNLPHLICSTDSHNIVAYRGEFFGIPKSLGSVRLEETGFDNGIPIVRSRSLRQLEDELLLLGLKSLPENIPRLVSDEGDFNLVYFGGTFYGLPKARGNCQLETLNTAQRAELVQDATLAGIKAKVVAMSKPSWLRRIARCLSATLRGIKDR